MISLGFQSSVLQPLPKTLTVCKPLQAAQIRVEGQDVCLSSTDLYVQLCCALSSIFDSNLVVEEVFRSFN